MNEPQIWTIIGVMSAVIIGMVTFGFTSMIRVMKAEIGSVNARIDGINTRIDSVNVRIDSMHSELGSKIENLDRDVQFLMNRQFDK